MEAIMTTTTARPSAASTARVWQRWVVAATFVCGAAACSSRANLDRVPIGTEVQITRQDGGVVTGTLASRDEQTARLDVGKTSRTVDRDQIRDVRVVDRSKPETFPSAARFREYTIPEGTELPLRVETSVSSATSREGDPVAATVTRAIKIDDATVIPEGSQVHGLVTNATPSGKVKGRASLAVRFKTLSAGGDSYAIAAGFSEAAAATKQQDAEKIGIPAAGGAIVGAILGGKKGAAAGAAIGGGAGTAVVLSTPGNEVSVARGSMTTVRLDKAVDVKVPLKKAGA
jgi:hypothetical protein